MARLRPPRSLSPSLADGVCRLFGEVTFDAPSFVRARELWGDASDVVVVPTSQSRLDALLIQALAAARPDFGLTPSHVRTANEVVAEARHERTDWSQQLWQWVQGPLSGLRSVRPQSMVFLEEQSSRSRRLMPVDQEALRLLLRRPAPVTLVPITLSYERVPEEVLHLRELRGQGAATLTFARLSRWLGRLWRREISLGQVHIRAGRPLVAGANDAVPRVAQRLVRRWEEASVTFDTALEAFTAAHPELGLDSATLRDWLARRGTTSLAPSVPPKAVTPTLHEPALERSWRHGWSRAFWPELTSRWPHCLALKSAAGVELAAGAAPASGPISRHEGPRLLALMEVLAKAISADYLAVLQGISRLVPEGGQVSLAPLRRQLLAEVHLGDGAWCDAAIQCAIERGVLQLTPSGLGISRTSDRQAMRELLAQCALGRDTWRDHQLHNEPPKIRARSDRAGLPGAVASPRPA